MIRIPLKKDDNFELLLEAIGYARITSMDMEIKKFLSDVESGSFRQEVYRLAAGQDMMAHLEVDPNSLEITLELHPRAQSVDSSLSIIVEAYFASKDKYGIADPNVFASKIPNQAAKGVKKWLNTSV